MAEKEVAKVGVAKPIPAYDVSYAWTKAMLMATTAYLFVCPHRAFIVPFIFAIILICMQSYEAAAPFYVTGLKKCRKCAYYICCYTLTCSYRLSFACNSFECSSIVFFDYIHRVRLDFYFL